MTKISKSTPAPTGANASIHCDGSCPANPGPMGIGYTIHFSDQHENEKDVHVGYRLGVGTNNRAEYLSLIWALRHALRDGATSVIVSMDSMLVVNHVGGKWKCKDSRLKPLLEEVNGLLKMFVAYSVEWVPREDNVDADIASKNPSEPSLPPSDIEVDLSVPVGKGFCPKRRKLTRRQAAMIRWWWMTRRCQNEARLSRIFDMAESHMGRVGGGVSYKDITEADLPGVHMQGRLLHHTSDLSESGDFKAFIAGLDDEQQEADIPF